MNINEILVKKIIRHSKNYQENSNVSEDSIK